MTDTSPHDHVYLGANHGRNEARTWAVIALTTAMMAAEIVAGTIYGSMALVADGWHMSTHAGALVIAALAYRHARRHALDPRFAFGTGKLGDLAAFASAIILAIVALLILWESLVRLRNPVEISFDQALLVAGIGLAVNLACAWLLHDGHDGHHHHHGHAHHDHGHGHDHDHAHHARDNNLRAAYLHVMADALTSVLAIVALLAGRSYGWAWLDPAIGVLGAAVILLWSWGLARDAGAILIDYDDDVPRMAETLRAAIETDEDTVVDLHLWHLGPGHRGAIVAIRSSAPKPLEAYRARLEGVVALSH
ncbi:MAG: CDF family Co(II)/Ni(II) efflux transporter DmeF, partial [Alphaproteobacteria bacterium]|nr:CDF family Co(II)/Ni(II) efflux transporter DmeF [Alphaproteobacteria bacterium]